MSRLLQSKLAVLRRRKTFVAVSTGVSLAVALLIVVTAVEMALDWWIELPTEPEGER